MFSRNSLILIGVATFLLFAMLNFPARVAYNWFVPDDIHLTGLGGSIWNGSAVEGSVGDMYFRNLSWTFKPFSLFVGKLAFDAEISTNAGAISTSAGIGFNGKTTLRDVVGSLTLAAVHPALQANRIDGALNIQMESMTLENGVPTAATGVITVGNLQAGGLSPDSLGNFRAEFSTLDDSIVGVVEDVGAVISVAGTITLGSDRSYLFTGSIAANAQTPPALNQNLRFLGSPDENGQRQFRFEGVL